MHLNWIERRRRDSPPRSALGLYVLPPLHPPPLLAIFDRSPIEDVWRVITIPRVGPVSHDTEANFHNLRRRSMLRPPRLFKSSAQRPTRRGASLVFSREARTPSDVCKCKCCVHKRKWGGVNLSNMNFSVFCARDKRRPLIFISLRLFFSLDLHVFWEERDWYEYI